MVRFLAELSKRSESLVYPTPYAFNKDFNLYYLDINKHPTSSYWLDWGGYYDNFSGHLIELYYSQFLQRVYSESQVQSIPFSLYINDRIVIFNIPKHPWLYPEHEMSGENVIQFLSTALNPDNPSNNLLEHEQTHIRLEVPNFTVKLSDNIAGVTLNQGFSISLFNDDGYFDDDEEWNLFNTPLYVKKAVVENPSFPDFKTIRNGLVENVSVAFNNIQINVSDTLRSLNEPVCNAITQGMFPGINITNAQALGKLLPVVYGQKRIKLLKLNDTQYAVAEGASTVSSVRDNSGNIISNSLFNYNPSTNILTSTVDIDSALVHGYSNNRIGRVIQDIITRKTRIQINDSSFNIAELNSYTNASAFINIAFSSGDVRKAIQAVLKNDLAFFIQQTDGRFTIRKYGNTYTTHTIPAWAITQKPSKDWSSAQENYFSSCIINYNYTDDTAYNSYLFNEREAEAESDYRKIVRKSFDTDLITQTEANRLAVLLSNRYTKLKKTLRVSVGIDASSFQLMDTVNLDLKINGRQFSKVKRFYIKEINHSHDILTLEEV